LPFLDFSSNHITPSLHHAQTPRVSIADFVIVVTVVPAVLRHSPFSKAWHDVLIVVGLRASEKTLSNMVCI